MREPLESLGGSGEDSCVRTKIWFGSDRWTDIQGDLPAWLLRPKSSGSRKRRVANPEILDAGGRKHPSSRRVLGDINGAVQLQAERRVFERVV